MYNNKKPIIIGVLCALIVVMAVGFALLSQELTITGTSHIDSNWNIRITNIRVKNLVSGYASGSNASSDVSGTTGCTTKTAPCNSTEATFAASLITPGDYIIYEVTITNSGTLDGVVESINLTCSENEAITCATSGLNVADTISHTSPNNTNTVDVTVTYNSATSSQPASTTSDITLTINYQQDLGQVQAPGVYSIGDIISYKGSNWYVIKDTTVAEDYVTLIRETTLSANELTENYSISLPWNSSRNTMAWYWDNNCHSSYTYGTDTYDSSVTSGCSGHNDYAGSKVKQAVEAYMTREGMINDLTEVDGYKIRLITVDELTTKFGYTWDEGYGGYYKRSGDTPSWIYSNTYWILPYSTDSLSFLSSEVGMRPAGAVFSTSIEYSNGSGVRPVINLLKTAIPPQS